MQHGVRRYLNHFAIKTTTQSSVAMAIADVFSKNGYTVPDKIAKILKISMLLAVKDAYIIQERLIQFLSAKR